jgi:predicted dehydrogenase
MDAVIITASTKSSDPVTQAARMSRKRGRIVLVGVAGLELNRADFYEKELSFQVSCSYGPGRYDPTYEEKGQDYPLGFVRWTEKRYFEAILDLMQHRRIEAASLITARFAFEDAASAYKRLTESGADLGLMLDYDAPTEQRMNAVIRFEARRYRENAPVIAVIGAGNYASRVLIPALRKAGGQLHSIVSAGGLSGAIAGRREGFAETKTDAAEVLADPLVNTVVIATRHDSHARLTVDALHAGKHVFVEKPLAIDAAGVDAVEKAFAATHQGGAGPLLMVGFNRRFAPQIVKMKQLLGSASEPKSFLMVMNAGAIPPGHWTQDVAVGGGRIIGEACHFIDLMRFLADAPIVSATARRMGNAPGVAITEDKTSITLGFADGSFGTIMYLANGAAIYPKERIEVFTAGRVLQLDNFRRMRGFGWPGFRSMNLLRQDKGQAAGAAAFLASIAAGQPAIPFEEIVEVARVSIEVASQLRCQ